MTFRLLAIRNSRKISVIVKSEATVDARGCVIRISAVFRDERRHMRLHIPAWASALLVLR